MTSRNSGFTHAFKHPLLRWWWVVRFIQLNNRRSRRQSTPIQRDRITNDFRREHRRVIHDLAGVDQYFVSERTAAADSRRSLLKRSVLPVFNDDLAAPASTVFAPAFHLTLPGATPLRLIASRFF
ncbi:MAG TPA: hypothetical protein VLC46_20440 [Thermoanaerobaculia bacterium]|nr:hypothetical protein [Thermoanaerobaculia bacterium]